MDLGGVLQAERTARARTLRWEPAKGFQRTSEMSLAGYRGQMVQGPMIMVRTLAFTLNVMGEPFKDSEQRSNVISQDHSDCCAGNKAKGVRVNANREIALMRLLPKSESE